jgi:hypothetical protein
MRSNPVGLMLFGGFALLSCIYPETGWTADQPGVIAPGDKWEYITAAYVVTWVGLIGYTISLWVRTPTKKRQ